MIDKLTHCLPKHIPTEVDLQRGNSESFNFLDRIWQLKAYDILEK